MEKFWIPKDVILFLNDADSLIVNNVFARTHIEVNAQLISLLVFLKSPQSQEELNEFVEKRKIPIKVKDLTSFSVTKGLFSDPTNLVREKQDLKKLTYITDFKGMLKLFKKRFIAISDYEKYKSLFGAQRNILDEEHIGNFHQQLGRELLFKYRIKPNKWWLDQKFNNKSNKLKNNLYKFIQFNFYKEFFTQEKIEGKKILDVGCGPGFYCRYLAKQGAEVLGIDPDGEYIRMAQSNAKDQPNVSFKSLDIGSGSALESLKDNYYDIIIFQDALLFYFVSPANKEITTRNKVLTELKRVLKKDGQLYIIDPNGIFWLAPWLGEVDRPFTILTEYRNKVYGVTPNLGQITGALFEAGFLISRIIEPAVSPETKRFNERGYYYSHNFPLWWIFELVKR